MGISDFTFRAFTKGVLLLLLLFPKRLLEKYKC